ncbi:DUF58 domain-containing protein [Hamadaea tsunoensis]|uniref:DUF58 domain-containing protein n=1 Tax=Hamadaea tsunoensis TaxID=53368 RepID=UPI0009FF4E02|nr:DUF58 domain-containing protein [Hamadaea tsunoensis]
MRPAVPVPGGDPPPEETSHDWHPTKALGRALVLVGLLLVGAVLFGRIDLVVIAVPFVASVAWGLSRRPRTVPGLRLATLEEYAAEGAELTTTLTAANRDVVAYDLVVARTQHSAWLTLRSTNGDKQPDRPVVAALNRGEAADVVLKGPARRWGRHSIGPAAAVAAAGGGLLACRAVVTGSLGFKVFPVTEPFAAVEAMPRAAGLVGQHRSRRAGEGGELAGVRQFGPGDRLRRIDWRTTLRTRQLHVARTLSDRDAEVVLLLDVLTEAGRSGGIAGEASVVDTTVRASAAIAEHYLTLGDRVSLIEYGANDRRLRPASGRRQFMMVLEWLLDVYPHQVVRVAGGSRLSAAISPNALVVVMTPLLDARSADMIAGLARAGRFVVTVDTLPAGIGTQTANAWTPAAFGIWRLERANTIGQLREHGVPVVSWQGAGSLDLVLRDVARMAGRAQGAGVHR